MTAKAHLECDWCGYKTESVAKTENSHGRSSSYKFPNAGWKNTSHWGYYDSQDDVCPTCVILIETALSEAKRLKKDLMRQARIEARKS